MKRFLTLAILWGGTITFMTEIAVGQQTATPAKAKTERHIKMLKVDDDGKKTEIDTVITGNAPFVWNGDTIGVKKELKWITRDNFTMDSIHQFDYKIEGDGKGKMIMMHAGKGDPMIWMEGAPGVPPPPHAPRVMRFSSRHGKNVIDLSDQGIISYDKKLRKDGTEKITIVRKQVPENEEFEHDVIMHAPVPPGEFEFHQGEPGKMKKIRVIKSEDGETYMIEDEEIIKIKEKKEGDETKVEVEVEKK